MKLKNSSELLRRFHRTPWRFQQTVETPLKVLPDFVKTICNAHAPLENGSLVVSAYAFHPNNLEKLLIRHSLPTNPLSAITIDAGDAHELQNLLTAAFADWVDFLFIPQPKPFVIYADHDEYTTFYANTKSNLNRVIEAMKAQKFKLLDDYKRTF